MVATAGQNKPKTLSIVLSRRMLVTLLCGFSSGMPLWVLYQLVPAWLRDNGVDLKTIGLFALVGLPYNWKFLWSPLFDAWLPASPAGVRSRWGRRRGWALITQIACLLSIAALALLAPTDSTATLFPVIALVALASASQDIVLDAYRRELLPDRELGLGNAIFVNAYRLSSLVPGSLALILADHVAWNVVFLVVAGFMLVGVATTLWMPETEAHPQPARTLTAAVFEPLRAFVSARGGRTTVALLAFLLLYKLGDSMATALATPFYLDMGFTKTEIGTIVKFSSLWASVTGATLGGLLMLRIGIHRALWLFGFVQLGSILGFALLAEVGADITPLWKLGSSDGVVVTVGHATLAAVVVFEYFGVGLGTAALVAFMARATDRRHTATQLALLTSLAALPRTFANATTGWIIESTGWTAFFLICAAIAVPGMLLLPMVAPWNDDPTLRAEDDSLNAA